MLGRVSVRPSVVREPRSCAGRWSRTHGFQGRRVALAQQGTELVGELLPVPQGVLLCAGEDGDRSGEIGVVGQEPVDVHVGAQDVGQD